MQVHLPTSIKHVQIDKAQSTVMIAIAVATAVSIFCLFSTKALVSQASYQRRVINARHDVVRQLNKNLESAKNLASQYQIFDSTNPNILGGKNTTDPNSNPPDGNNARLVLNALPTKYDFPALISSLSKILDADGIDSQNISASDQPESFDSKPTANPRPVSIPLSISGSSSYAGLQTLIKDFERSTRPYDITSLELSGSSTSMSISMIMNTYYQQAKSLNLGSKEIR